MITIPTPQELKDQKISDFESALSQTLPSSNKSFLKVWAKSDSLTESLLYKFGLWIYKQIFPATMDDEALDLKAAEFGIYRTSPVAAILEAEITGENDKIIESGTTWQFNSIVYNQLEDVVIESGVSTITVECLTKGIIGNIDNGSSLMIVSPLAGVDDAAIITSTNTNGLDAEDTESFRDRLINRMAQRPQGGSVPDYIIWAGEVSGIVKSFAFNNGLNNVIVYPLQSLTVDRIPDNTKLTEVEDYLNEIDRKPMCANVTAEAMTEREITLTVSSINPDNAIAKAAIEVAIANYLLTCFPKQYPDETDPTNIISLSTLYAESRGAGANSISMEMEIDGVPGVIESYTLLDNEIIKLASMIWP